MENSGDKFDPNKDEDDITEDSIDEQEQSSDREETGMHQQCLLTLVDNSNNLVTRTPLHIDNEIAHAIAAPNNQNNTHQDVRINNSMNEDATIYSDNNNDDAIVYGNHNDEATNAYIDNEPNVQDIVKESVTSEAVDEPEYVVANADIENNVLLNHDSNQENDETSDSDDGFHTDNESDSSWDDFDADTIHDIYFCTNDNGNEISTNGACNTTVENVSLTDSDQEDNVIELQDNTPLEQNISTATTSDSAFTIEINADTSIKVEFQETIVSINPTDVDSIEQSSDINLNNEPNDERSLSSVADNSERIINPSVSTEIQEDPRQNHNVDVDNEQFHFFTGDIDGQNVHPAVDNIERGQTAFCVAVIEEHAQSNTQFNEPSPNDEQAMTQNFPSAIGSDQSSQIEQKAGDDHEKSLPANRPTSMQFQKQIHPLIEPNEEPPKQNAD